MSKNEMEFEFDLSAPAAVNQPKEPETNTKAEEVKTELSNFKVSMPDAPTEKIVISEIKSVEKPKEMIFVETKPENIKTNTSDETKIKVKSGIKFTAIITILALIILAVVIFLYAGSLSKLSTANTQIQELTQAKAAVETQLNESNAKIAELDKTIAKLQDESQKWADDKAKLKKGINGLNAKNLKTEKTRLLKLVN